MILIRKLSLSVFYSCNACIFGLFLSERCHCRHIASLRQYLNTLCMWKDIKISCHYIFQHMNQQRYGKTINKYDENYGGKPHTKNGILKEIIRKVLKSSEDFKVPSKRYVTAALRCHHCRCGCHHKPPIFMLVSFFGWTTSPIQKAHFLWNANRKAIPPSTAF